MCNCIEDIEKMLTEKMQEEYPGWEVIEPVAFTEQSYILGEGGGIILGNPVLGRVQKGKSKRKFETKMFPTYCPFCGKPVKKTNK